MLNNQQKKNHFKTVADLLSFPVNFCLGSDVYFESRVNSGIRAFGNTPKFSKQEFLKLGCKFPHFQNLLPINARYSAKRFRLAIIL